MVDFNKLIFNIPFQIELSINVIFRYYSLIIIFLVILDYQLNL